MTFGLGSDVLEMLSKEYKGLLENPEETLIGNLRAFNMLRAIVWPMTKEEQELQNKAFSGIWTEIKSSINTDIINGNPYTATRFISDITINIGSLFFGAGELKAAVGVKETDNVIDGVRVIDKVSDVSKAEKSIAVTAEKAVAYSKFSKKDFNRISEVTNNKVNRIVDSIDNYNLIKDYVRDIECRNF